MSLDLGEILILVQTKPHVEYRLQEFVENDGNVGIETEERQIHQDQLAFNEFEDPFKSNDQLKQLLENKNEDDNEKEEAISEKGVKRTERIIYECYLCERVRYRFDHMRSHMLVHTGEPRYSCDNCSLRFAFKTDLFTHKRIHTGIKPFNCDQCPLKFRIKKKLDAHKRIHFDPKPFHCDKCFYETSHKKSLAIHKELLHPHKNSFSCVQCLSLFVLKQYLDKHNLTINGIPKSCFQCSAELTHEHKRTQTDEVLPSFKSKTKSKSRKNKRIQTDDTLCSNSYKYSEKSLIDVNPGEKIEFSSDQCASTFNEHSESIQPRGAHSNGKPFVCDKCLASFKREETLRIHQRMH